METERLWAVTCYFNPLGWSSRRKNYSVFRRELTVPLLTVEWHPEGNFELDSTDAEILVQVRGGDLMWQKERLLNLGIERLPADAEFVAWLDCDVVFGQAHWAEAALQALETHVAVQPFSAAVHLTAVDTANVFASEHHPASVVKQAERVVPSSASVIAGSGTASFGELHRGSPGHGWVARRETIAEVSLFDRAVTGGGDFFWLVAALGNSREWLDARRHTGLYGFLEASSYLDWASRAHEIVRGRMGALNGDLFHLYHGRLDFRQYWERFRPLEEHGFDIDQHLGLTPGGVWEFTRSEEPLRQAFLQYFAGRREDHP